MVTECRNCLKMGRQNFLFFLLPARTFGKDTAFLARKYINVGSLSWKNEPHLPSFVRPIKVNKHVIWRGCDVQISWNMFLAEPWTFSGCFKMIFGSRLPAKEIIGGPVYSSTLFSRVDNRLGPEPFSAFRNDAKREPVFTEVLWHSIGMTAQSSQQKKT